MQCLRWHLQKQTVLICSHLWIKRQLNPQGGRSVRSFIKACVLLSDGQSLSLSCKYLALGSGQPQQAKAPRVWAPRAAWTKRLAAPAALVLGSFSAQSALSFSQLHLFCALIKDGETPSLSLHWHFPRMPHAVEYLLIHDALLTHRASCEQELVRAFSLVLFLTRPRRPPSSLFTHPPLGWNRPLPAACHPC